MILTKPPVDLDVYAQGSISDENNNSGGSVDGIAAVLNVNGQSDVLNIDDAGDTNNNSGALTATTLSGLDMAGSIVYDTIEDLNVELSEWC